MGETSEAVGFVGLGVMGLPMARNLLRAGHTIVAHTRRQEVLAELAAEGARAASDPAGVAAAAGLVITMLPDGPAVEEVFRGPRGIFAGAQPGCLLVDMSTIDPATSRSLAVEAEGRGLRMLDAPVSGGDVGARDGALSIMVGGTPEDFDRARPVFAVLGRTVTHVGPSGAGQVVKACNQVVVGITYAAVAEALVLGSKAGVDPAAILDALGGGLAANRVMEVRRRNLLDHDFAPGFRVDLHHKDLGIALDAAAEADVALPATALVRQMLQALRARGDGGLDHSALLTVVERLADHRI